MTARLVLAATALLLPASLAAQTGPNGEVRLTPQEVDQVLADAAAKRHATEQASAWQGEALAPEELPDRPARPVHGEMGFAVGTGGYRSAFGTAVVPIGKEGSAAISFETGRHRYGPYEVR